MRVSVLSWDLSHNCLGRAYLIAQLLENEFEVEIVGPKLRGDVWSPVRDAYDYKEMPTKDTVLSFKNNYNKCLNQIDGDIIYASKPRMTSFGVGLLEKKQTGKPLLLDIDDWERSLEFIGGSSLLGYLAGIPRLGNVNSLYYNIGLEQLVSYADGITVSNSFLQHKFGGDILPHVRDTTKFDPQQYKKQEMRQQLGLPPEDNLILFSGTPKPHKGLENLVRAVRNIDENVTLVIVGADQSQDRTDISISYKIKSTLERRYIDKLSRLGGDSIILRGQQPFSEIPKWLSAADIVAIPQQETHKTRGQLPAKVFDAMAMATPIIATNVSDLPVVLRGCGKIVEPDSVAELKAAVQSLITDPSYMTELGSKARRKAVDQYSYQSASPTLCEKVQSVYDETR